ncbi:hypothetical protein AM499_14985 [Bacillus sp. FJAT-22090]|uniref:hypothetical protein n=1 Tax=Bacillus sp. FJAT-22090 TaxID=1581038 RepID=UPI0006AE1A27|nr:hypothetical protein [Bacillus sp. FJAT-22090]ALC86979.1 hypothetical protein AM499_14985 [Bacillus sp. FJAT-22090]
MGFSFFVSHIDLVGILECLVGKMDALVGILAHLVGKFIFREEIGRFSLDSLGAGAVFASHIDLVGILECLVGKMDTLVGILAHLVGKTAYFSGCWPP